MTTDRGPPAHAVNDGPQEATKEAANGRVKNKNIHAEKRESFEIESESESEILA